MCAFYLAAVCKPDWTDKYSFACKTSSKEIYGNKWIWKIENGENDVNHLHGLAIMKQSFNLLDAQCSNTVLDTWCLS